MNTRQLTTLALAAVTITGAFAQTQKFTFGNAGGMKVAQTFTFDSEADFENFTGQTHKITGNLSFDPVKHTGSGKIIVDLASVDTGIALRNEHLRSEMWFNTAKFPQAVFQTTSVKHKTGDTYTISGKLSMHGVTKTVSTTATVRYLKASAATKKAMFSGNVVNVKAAFKVRLADYGVTIPSMAKGKVAETITVRINAFGMTG